MKYIGSKDERSIAHYLHISHVFVACLSVCCLARLRRPTHWIGGLVTNAERSFKRTFDNVKRTVLVHKFDLLHSNDTNAMFALELPIASDAFDLKLGRLDYTTRVEVENARSINASGEVVCV